MAKESKNSMMVSSMKVVGKMINFMESVSNKTRIRMLVMDYGFMEKRLEISLKIST